MNKLDKDYQALLQDILDNGVTKQDRTGTGTISVFGRQIRHNMKDGFPLLTTKKMYFKGISTELLWFLQGRTDLKYLLDNDCHIWDGDAYKFYVSYFTKKYSGENLKINQYPICENNIKNLILSQEEFINKIKTDDEFAKTWGELGPIYGKQWRQWQGWLVKDGKAIGSLWYDQIARLVNDLQKNPDSRRLMVSAWNVAELDKMTLPPCHYGFQVYTRELSHKERCDLFGHNDSIDRDYSYSKWLDDNGYPKRAISLMWNQRSVDTFLGLPFNIASYGLLLEIIAKAVNMVPDELIGNLGDVHLYSNHIEQAKEQIGRKLIIEERVRWAYDRKLIDYVTMVESDELDRLNVPTHTRQPYPLPTLKIENEVKWVEGDCLPYYSLSDFTVENYQSHPTIKAPLSN